jgi:hypothetical protein
MPAKNVTTNSNTKVTRTALYIGLSLVALLVLSAFVSPALAEAGLFNRGGAPAIEAEPAAQPAAPAAVYVDPVLGTGPGGVGTTDGTSDLVLWLRPDSMVYGGSGNVNSWVDVSGHGNNFGPGPDLTGRDRPNRVAGVLNGYDVARFSDDGGVDDFMTSSFNPGDDATVFVVFKMNAQTDGVSPQMGLIGAVDWVPSISSNRSYMAVRPVAGTDRLAGGVGDYYSGFNGPTSLGTTNFQVGILWYRQSGGARLYLNGALEASATPVVTVTTNPYHLGQINPRDSSQENFDGDIAEVVVYDRSLHYCEQVLVNNYLSAKYGIPMVLRDYYNEANGFDMDVAGICGNGIGAAQKSSPGNAGGLILENAGFLQDNGDYMIAGHNGVTGKP